MIGPIVESSFDIDHWIASNDTIFQCFANAILDVFNIFFGHHAPNDSIDKLKTLAALVWRYFNPHVTILPMPTSLPDVPAFGLGLTRNRLAIGNLRAPHICLNLKLTEEAIDNHFQMKLSHTTNDSLTSFYIGMYLESRIFFRQFSQSNSHLILVSAGPWLDRNRDHRLWERDRLKDNGMLGIAQRITSKGIAQTYSSADITCPDFIDILPVIGMHTQQAPNTFCLALSAILNSRALRQCTRIHTQVCQTPHKWIRNNFEGECAKWCGIAYLTSNDLIDVRVYASWRRDIKWRGKICNYSI